MSDIGPLGIAIPQGITDPAVLSRVVRRLDDIGVDAAWTVDQAQGPAPTLEPIATLSMAAALTSKVRLGIGVLGTASRSPLNLAKSLATLDHLSGGRLEVGFGLGDLKLYGAQGYASHPPGAVVDAVLETVAELWSGAAVTRVVGPYQLDGEVSSPGPSQQPHPPIWIGGRSDNGLRRAATIGAGWMGAGISGFADFAADVVRLREVLDGQGRDPTKFPVAKRLYVQVAGADEHAERRRVEEWFRLFYGDADRAGSSVVGSPSACIDAIRKTFESGATHVVVHPVLGGEAQQQLLAEHVFGEVR